MKRSQAKEAELVKERRAITRERSLSVRLIDIIVAVVVTYYY